VPYVLALTARYLNLLYATISLSGFNVRISVALQTDGMQIGQVGGNKFEII
jgi:hypothetical protein